MIDTAVPFQCLPDPVARVLPMTMVSAKENTKYQTSCSQVLSVGVLDLWHGFIEQVGK
jgi:hypothetical protein